MNGWARNSRFWKITPWVVLLSAALSILFDDPTAFIAVTSPWITVAGGKSIVSTYRGTEPAAVSTSRPAISAPHMVYDGAPSEYDGDPPGGEA